MNSDGSVLVTRPNGTQSTYAATENPITDINPPWNGPFLALKQITSPTTKTVTLSYSPEGIMTGWVDSDGVGVQAIVTGSNANARITSAKELPSNATWVYQYDNSNEYLSYITDPNGNTFDLFYDPTLNVVNGVESKLPGSNFNIQLTLAALPAGQLTYDFVGNTPYNLPSQVPLGHDYYTMTGRYMVTAENGPLNFPQKLSYVWYDDTASSPATPYPMVVVTNQQTPDWDKYELQTWLGHTLSTTANGGTSRYISAPPLSGGSYGGPTGNLGGIAHIGSDNSADATFYYPLVNYSYGGIMSPDGESNGTMSPWPYVTQSGTYPGGASAFKGIGGSASLFPEQTTSVSNPTQGTWFNSDLFIEVGMACDLGGCAGSWISSSSAGSETITYYDPTNATDATETLTLDQYDRVTKDVLNTASPTTEVYGYNSGTPNPIATSIQATFGNVTQSASCDLDLGNDKAYRYADCTGVDGMNTKYTYDPTTGLPTGGTNGYGKSLDTVGTSGQLLTRTITPQNGTAATASWTGYNATGDNPTGSTDFAGRTWSFGYYSSGLPESDSVSHGGYAPQLNYNQWDGANRLLAWQLSNGVGQTITPSFAALGAPSQTGPTSPPNPTGAGGMVISSICDSNGNVEYTEQVPMVDNYGNANGGWSYVLQPTIAWSAYFTSNTLTQQTYRAIPSLWACMDDQGVWSQCYFDPYGPPGCYPGTLVVALCVYSGTCTTADSYGSYGYTNTSSGTCEAVSQAAVGSVSASTIPCSVYAPTAAECMSMAGLGSTAGLIFPIVGNSTCTSNSYH